MANGAVHPAGSDAKIVCSPRPSGVRPASHEHAPALAREPGPGADRETNAHVKSGQAGIGSHPPERRSIATCFWLLHGR